MIEPKNMFKEKAKLQHMFNKHLLYHYMNLK